MRSILLIAAACVVSTAGCAALAPQTQSPLPATAAQTHHRSWMSPDAASNNLLYISDAGYNAVFVYAYTPRGMKFDGIITGVSFPGPMCVDKQQNVWILSEYGIGSYAATEYAHGASEPTATVIDPAGYPSGCGVDLATGTLAISSRSLNQTSGTIAIFRHERGKPQIYTDDAIPGFYSCCTYDDAGNLYGDGTVDTNQNLVLAELPRGSSTFKSITFDRDFARVGGLQWHRGHLTIGDQYDGAIYSYKLSANGPQQTGMTKLNGINYLGGYFIQRNRVIAADSYVSSSGDVGIFSYPAGGDPIRVRPFSTPIDVVVSLAARPGS